VTIDGKVTANGSVLGTVTIDFNGGVGFVVYQTGVLGLQNLTLANARGGVIQNLGTVNVIHSTFSNNSSCDIGGAIANLRSSTLTVTHSTFSGNAAECWDWRGDSGGAIYNDGTATVTHSTFSGNRVRYLGGAIFNNEGTLNVAHSTFSSNVAASTIFDDYAGTGGAIHNNGTASVVNSAFSGNSAALDGGALSNAGSLQVINSTLSGNSTAQGGGIVNLFGSSLTLKNTIVAQNTLPNCAGAGIIDGGYNLDDDGACGLNPANHSQPGVDPQLDPNGSLALLPGSPALDAADDGVCAAPPVNNLDLGGVTRPRGPHCDIGAYEMPRATLIVVNHVINDNGGSSSASDFTLNVAASYPSLTSFVGAEAPGTVVGLAPGTYSVTHSGPAGYTSTAANCSGTLADNQTVTCTYVNDDDGATGYTFSGFFQPVDNLPALNVANAGGSIPVKFSLNGDQGLTILAAGYPVSTQIACAGDESPGVIEPTLTTGGSSLSYDAASDTYTYVWRTNRAWAGTCRQLTVRLSDGTDHLANFKFRP
jgi:predicted outer membrane repeat protein